MEGKGREVMIKVDNEIMKFRIEGDGIVYGLDKMIVDIDLEKRIEKVGIVVMEEENIKNKGECEEEEVEDLEEIISNRCDEKKK